MTLCADAAFGQSEPRSAVWFIGGAASGASDTGAALGGSLLVNLHERVLIEGQGMYVDRGDGADAWHAVRPGSGVCPAPGSGFGLGVGPGFGSGSRTCPASAGGYWRVGALPTFYARRL
jgi:hypothetical protein